MQASGRGKEILSTGTDEPRDQFQQGVQLDLHFMPFLLLKLSTTFSSL